MRSNKQTPLTDVAGLAESASMVPKEVPAGGRLRPKRAVDVGSGLRGYRHEIQQSFNFSGLQKWQGRKGRILPKSRICGRRNTIVAPQVSHERPYHPRVGLS